MVREVCLLSYCILLLLTPAQPRDCTRALDVVFLLDSGPDISTNDRNSTINLTKDVASQLRPSEFGTHVALAQFARDTTIVHRLGTELDFDNNGTVFARGRNLSDAIDKTRQVVLDNAEGDRPEVPDLMVIISHGPSDDRNAAVTAATDVKWEGIRIITVGMTNTHVDQLREELREIATDPNDIDHLMPTSPNYYTSVLPFLVQAICKNEAEAANESLRLVDGTSNSGRLEAYVNEEWVTVCSTNWTWLSTKVACKELGFPDGQVIYSMNHTSYLRRVGVDNIRCAGNESKLLGCPRSPLFQLDSSCDHSHDVFLQCLCSTCDDEYRPQVNVRLEDRQWPTSGRVEVFSLGLRWGGVCGDGWTTKNTRVVCRQLGFLDGAGTVEGDLNQYTHFVLFNVNCSGNENSVFDCSYRTTSSGNCSHAVYIQCECHQCPQFVVQAPQQLNAMTQSSVVIQWQLTLTVRSCKFWYLSQKNPLQLMSVSGRKVVKEYTPFADRIELVNINSTTIGLKLDNITAADMGMYAIDIAQLRLFDSQAVLIVDDFAVVPDPVLHYMVSDRVVLRWDLAALERVNYINYDIVLTTPATGRIPLDHYYDQWLKFNPGRHLILQFTQKLYPTIIIEEVAVNDAGIYSIDVKVMSHTRRWINASWQLSTNLIIVGNVSTSPPLNNNSVDVDDVYLSANSSVPLVSVIVLGSFLGLSLIVIAVLICCFRIRSNKLTAVNVDLTAKHSRALQAAEQSRQQAQEESRRAEQASRLAQQARQREDQASRRAEEANRVADEARRVANDATRTAEDASRRANEATQRAFDEIRRREEAEERERHYAAELDRYIRDEDGGRPLNPSITIHDPSAYQYADDDRST